MKRLLSPIFQKWHQHRRPDARGELMENRASAGELQMDMTQRHERCHNAGNDLMTGNVSALAHVVFACLDNVFMSATSAYSSKAFI